jgi:hypothetical protein
MFSILPRPRDRSMPPIRALVLTLVGLLGTAGGLFAQASAIPTLSSRPGAAYTLYLNFAGFTFTGVWGGSFGSSNPGLTPAYTTDANANFSAAELTNIRTIWSRTAEMYSAFDVNVTTVDPAVAAGQAGSDALRQAFYDSQARMMHTVVGGNGGWLGGGGGISYQDVISTSWSTSGINGGAGRGVHTNFVFSDNFTFNGNPGWERPVALSVGHENGHAFNLNHQSQWSGGTLVQEYDPGGSGAGSKGPIMGAPFNSERGLWRVGTATEYNNQGQPVQIIQNDVQRLQANAGIRPSGSPTGFVDSGIGHTRATATPLPLTGTAINSTLAKGVITPTNSDNPNPSGEANYTTDYFRFSVAAGLTANLSATLRSGRSTLTAGTADPGATLNATLRLLDANGGQLQIANTGVFVETITANNLAAGDYFLQISSAGGDAQYFDIGSYFLTGTLTPVPEPATVVGAGAAVLAVGALWRRRRTAG